MTTLSNDADLPDRGHLSTEQRLPASNDLDAMSIIDGLRVISDQDATITEIINLAIPAIAALVETIVKAMRRGGRLIYIGAGTSGRLGVLDASEIPPTFQADPSQVVGLIAGGDGALRMSSEGKEDEWDGAFSELATINIGDNDTVIGIAAGGTTPYVLGGVAKAKQLNAATGLIVCVDEETVRATLQKSAKQLESSLPLQAAVDHLICLPVGPEVVTGSTRMKAGTATKLALNMISTMTMVELGKTWGNLMIDVRATNAKLRDRAARILTQQCEISREQAFELLDRAQGHVKAALVMHLKNVTYREAVTLLDDHDQQLRHILGPPLS